MEISEKDGVVMFALDLDEDIMGIAEKGFLKEAVARLDSLIDFLIAQKVREYYKNEYVNEILGIILRSKNKSVLLDIVRKKRIISKSLLKKIEKFKNFRNVVLHNMFGEYKYWEEKDSYLSMGIEIAKKLGGDG